jgi:HlyD family secretion protein
MIMKRTRHVKRYLWTGLVLTGAVATVWALRPGPVPAAMARVQRGSLAATVSGEGRTRVKDLYVVSAPVDGALERLVARPGDLVQANDVVAQIRPAASRPLDPRTRAQASAAVAAAKAAVARAEASEREAGVAREHAESIFARTQSLARSGAAPKADAEHSGHEAEIRRRAAEAAGAGAAEARAELSRALAALSPSLTSAGQTLAVRAPAAGKVLRVLRESAGPVVAGAPLLEVGEVAHLEVSADLLSSDAATVRPGARAFITGWGGSQAIAARVRRIDPAAFTKVSALGLEEQRVRVVLDLTAPPPAGLGHDYRVDVSVVVWEGQDLLRVPSTALFRVGERWAVFVVSDDRAARAPVEVGPSDGTWTVATNGVREGEVVITQPSDAIQPGTRVTGAR